MDEAQRAALDLVPEAVLVLTSERTIEHANDRAMALLALSHAVVGEPFEKVLELHDDAGNRCTSAVVPDSDVDRVAERVYRIALPDGRMRPVSVAGRFLADGRVTLTFRSAGRRERVDRARSDLVATVSHEIRSPLTSVKGFTRTMLAKWDRFSDEQKRTMLETINADADRVTRLLKELLDVSRIDAGRVQLHRRMVDVRGLVGEVVDKARHRPEGAERELGVHIEGDLPAIYADPDKLEQIITNLVENALKYAPDSPVDVRVEAVDHAVEIAVSDRGPGIPPDQARRIFEKFGRGRDNRRSGTGLGLYITRGLATAMGGDVWLVDDHAPGAEFRIRLPVSAPPGAEAAEA